MEREYNTLSKRGMSGCLIVYYTGFSRDIENAFIILSGYKLMILLEYTDDARYCGMVLLFISHTNGGLIGGLVPSVSV